MGYTPTGRPPGRPKKPSTMTVGGKELPNLTEAQWKAIRAEFSLLGNKDRSVFEWPTNIPLAQIAMRSGVSRQVISKWRKQSFWQAALMHLFSQRIGQELLLEIEQDAAEERIALTRKRNSKSKR